MPSTPDDPARAVLGAFGQAGAGDPDAWIVHGSTVATNALLERKLARTALVTTDGFADLIDIARQNRASLYDLDVTIPPPLVPADLRVEIAERTLASGERTLAPSAADLESMVARFQIGRSRSS